MHTYELVTIFRVDLSSDDMVALTETLTGWIEASGGKILETHQWGRRRLAYQINKQRDGYYILFKVELSSGAPVEIERNMQISEQILRYMITRVEQ